MPHDIAWQHEAAARVQATTLAPAPEYRGRVEEVADGVAMISGLPHLRLGELLRFDSGAFGFAQVLEPDRIGCVLLDAARALQAGDAVRGTGDVVRVPVGACPSSARHRALSTGIW
jgi:F-type H+-transporting ATPase subunit alpha